LEWAADTACGNARDRLVIRFGSLEDIQISDNIALCTPETVTLEGTLPFDATGEWRILEGSSGSFGDPNAATTTFRGTWGQSYLIEWRVETEDCGSAAQTMTVDIGKYQPDRMDAGSPQEVWMGELVQLDAEKADSSNGMWRVIDAPLIANPHFTDPTDPKTLFDPGPNGIGTFILEWTESFANCFSYSDRITIKVRSNAELLDLVFTSENSITTGSGPLFTDEGVYFGNYDSPESHLYFMEPETGAITDLGAVTQAVDELYALGDLIILRGRFNFSFNEMYVFDTRTQTLIQWEEAASFTDPSVLYNDQALVVRMGSTGTFVIDPEGRRTTLTDAIGTNGFLTGNQYFFMSEEFPNTVRVFDVTTQNTSDYLTFSDEDTAGVRPRLVRMLDQRLIYFFNNGDLRDMLFSTSSQAAEPQLLASDISFSLRHTPSGTYFKGNFSGDEAGVGFYRTDGTIAGTQNMAWEGLTFEDLSRTQVHGEHLLLLDGDLHWLPADGQQVQTIGFNTGFLRNSGTRPYQPLPGGEALFLSRRLADHASGFSRPQTYVFHHIGDNPTEYYNFEITVNQDRGYGFIGLSGSHIVTGLSVSFSTGRPTSLIQTMPYAPFADPVNLETAGSLCPEGSFEVVVTDETATDIEWHIEGAEFMAIHERSIQVRSDFDPHVSIRARMRNASGQLENHMLRVETHNTIPFEMWRDVVNNFKVTDLIREINQCGAQ
jgi:hypothetical protein